MSDLKDRIKNKFLEELNEVSSKNPFLEYKKQRAKVLNITHTGFDTYKNKNGDIFVWDGNKKDYRPTNTINDKVKNFIDSKEVNKFKETFFDFILKNKIDVSKVKTDDLLNKYLVRRFNGESVNHLRDYFYQTMNDISDKKFDKNNFNYEHNDLNQLLLKIGGLVSSYKRSLTEDLDESFISVKADFRNQKSKVMNLQHVGHGTYKNPAGHEFTWDDTKNDFVLVKKNVIPFQKKSEESSDMSNLKQGDRIELDYKSPGFDSALSRLKGNTHFSVNDVQEVGNNIPILYGKKGYQLRSSDAGKPLVLLWVRADDNFFKFKYIGPKKQFDKNGQWTNKDIPKEEPKEKKSMFNNPPPGGWTDADKVPQSVNDEIKKGDEYQKKNKELLKSQDVYNKNKGDTFKQFDLGYRKLGKEMELKIVKIVNTKTDRRFHLKDPDGNGYGTMIIPHPAKSSPEVIQKTKDFAKGVLSKPKDDFEIEEVEKESGRNVKLVSPNWALHVREGYGDISFKIYNNLENIGRKGKTVKETTLHFYLHPTEQVGRTAWNPTIVSRIKDAKPKSPEDLEKFIEDQINKVKAEEPKTTIYPKREDELKGIDRDIPDFGLEGDYKDFSGKDINVKYKKPTINITSKKRTERSDNHYNSGIDVKWNYAKKLKKIEDKLKDAENEDQIIKLLDDNGIKYKSYMYSRWD